MILAESWRSGYVEDRHHGSLVVLLGDGSVVLSLGDVTTPVFPRSANKPLQAAAMLDLGWEPAEPRELALATASHSGEPGHLEVVRRMLGELRLQCPVQQPLGAEAWSDLLRAGGAATRLTMTCSGKHAAMLRTCVVNGWSTDDYLAFDSPLQIALRDAVGRAAAETVEQVAVDGCGAPQHGLSLTALARAFGRLDPRVADAMRQHPWDVAGTGRHTTRLMEGVPGLVVKDGAASVYAAGLPDGSAVALKIDDGSEPARTPVLVAGLRALGLDAPVLDELAETPVLGGDARVGAVRVVF